MITLNCNTDRAKTDRHFPGLNGFYIKQTAGVLKITGLQFLQFLRPEEIKKFDFLIKISLIISYNIGYKRKSGFVRHNIFCNVDNIF